VNLLPLLHLCDSLFPIGGFSYSDGLEAAASVRLKAGTTYDRRSVRLKADATYVSAATGADSGSYVASGFRRTCIKTAADLRDWLDVCLDETFTRLEGPAVRDAWQDFAAGEWTSLATLDREVIALRPSSSARRATRAMGLRLVTTWSTLHANPRLEHVVELARAGTFAPTLPVAFGIACAATAIPRRDAIGGYAYTRLASTASAAMRLVPIGQTAAHCVLAQALERVPAAVDAIEASTAPLECFTPLMDIAAMSQQYMESRLFRS
jgi:urease accessory protein